MSLWASLRTRRSSRRLFKKWVSPRVQQPQGAALIARAPGISLRMRSRAFEHAAFAAGVVGCASCALSAAEPDIAARAHAAHRAAICGAHGTSLGGARVVKDSRDGRFSPNRLAGSDEALSKGTTARRASISDAERALQRHSPAGVAEPMCLCSGRKSRLLFHDFCQVILRVTQHSETATAAASAGMEEPAPRSSREARPQNSVFWHRPFRTTVLRFPDDERAARPAFRTVQVLPSLRQRRGRWTRVSWLPQRGP